MALLLAYQYLLSGITGTTVHAKLQFSRSPSPQTPDLQISLFSPTFLSPLIIIIHFYF
jgi:hypothetical protein